MAFFSIIIPVYNGAAWINEALDSLMNQSFTNFEVVIVNDGSTDNSVYLINEFIQANKGLDIKLINQENKGLGNARNNGVQQAIGEWLAFLDADDYWSMHKLLHCHQAIVSSGYKWLYHEIFERYENGRLRRRKAGVVNSIASWFEAGNPLVPSATCIRKDLFVENSGFDEERDRVEDLGLWLRLFKNNVFPHFIEEALTGYRMGSGVTNNMQDHYDKVMVVMNEAVAKEIISAKHLVSFEERKSYEFARQSHKLGMFKEALAGYAKNKKSLKIIIFKLFAKLRISI